MPESAQVKTFAGKFRHTVDSKNRVTIPAMWRTGEEEQYYAAVGQGSEYINLYPPAIFQRKGESLKEDPRIAPRDKRIYVRHFYSNAHVVTTDRQGRILIPSELVLKTSLGADVYLLGTDERIEIWPVARYDDSFQDQEITYEQVANILGD